MSTLSKRDYIIVGIFYLICIIAFPVVKYIADAIEKHRAEVQAQENRTAALNNDWLYGTWKCNTPDGTIVLIIEKGGRIYDGIDDKWYTYTIKGDEIVEQLNGYISTYHIDRINKRFDCGKPGLWFHKEITSDSNSHKEDKVIKEKTTFYHESDIHNYLRSNSFTNRTGDITITEGYNMALRFNGREMTGAIMIYSFNSHQAVFSAHCPINGVTYRFKVDNSTGTLYCDNENEYYYAR